MKILLVEPDFRKSRPNPSKNKTSDEALWYPPLGLMKLARFHKNRGDYVRFVVGCDKSVLPSEDLFDLQANWDRVYITTLFTFNFKKTVETIKFYIEAVGGTLSKIFVGGIMASLMSDELYCATNIRPICGILHSPAQIGLPGDEDIDLLPPDYKILDQDVYAIRNTYYGYTTRGCVNKCAWCGVPSIEPNYEEYFDIKPMITFMRKEYGDKSLLKLMDNNVLASKRLDEIVDDLVSLGYGREPKQRKTRVVDFNQGLDASFITEEKMQLLSKLNIRPMRIAFDRVQEKEQYINALQLANKYDVPEFSNYMLFNFKDTPRDLYERLMINIKLNEQWLLGKKAGKIYSYPMRYAPINDINGKGTSQSRESSVSINDQNVNWKENPQWTRRFTRNIEIIKGASHGAISPTPSLARRAIGETFEEFLTNLYMPEEFLRNRNKHELKVYKDEPKRKAGSGLVEEFRKFILDLLAKQDDRFYFFHSAVTQSSTLPIRVALNETKDPILKNWLTYYVKSET